MTCSPPTCHLSVTEAQLQAVLAKRAGSLPSPSLYCWLGGLYQGWQAENVALAAPDSCLVGRKLHTRRHKPRSPESTSTQGPSVQGCISMGGKGHFPPRHWCCDREAQHRVRDCPSGQSSPAEGNGLMWNREYLRALMEMMG